MRNSRLWVCFAWLLLCLVRSGWAETITPDSKIVQIAVYPDSVMVTRQTEVKLTPGEHAIKFEDIVTPFEQNSLSVKGEGTAQVKLFGAQIKQEYLIESANERLKDLQNRIEGLDDELMAKNAESQVLEQKKQFLESVKLFSAEQLPKDLVTKMPTTAELEGTLEFVTTQFAAIEQSREEIRLAIRDLQRKREALVREMNDVRGPQNRQKQSVWVDLNCVQEGSLTVQISYLVRGVSWYPQYDARASLTQDDLELTTFGVVTQNSGEDWNDVEMLLSTAQPSIGGRMPQVIPWILRAYQPPPPMARQRGMLKAAVDDIGDQYSPGVMSALAGAPMMEAAQKVTAEPAYSQVQSKGISVNYKLPRKATIKSDGSEHKFPVASLRLVANYEYSAYPRLSPFVYLGSKIKNTSEAQLLAGQVNIFLEGDFVGNSSLDHIGPGEEFPLFLGADDNVKAKKEEIQRQVDETMLGGLPSPNRKTTLKYKLTVENYKSKTVKLNLFDAVPIAEDDRIKVKLSEVSVTPTTKDWENRKGVWKWELTLAPAQKQEIHYTVIIEHPKDLQIEGL